MKFIDLLISPNVKRIYNNHFDNLRSSIPNCSLQYHTIDSKQVIVIKIHDKDHLSDLQDEYHTWYKQFQKDGLLEDVSITGVKENMNDGQGSTRYSTNSSHLSTYLTKIINSFTIGTTNLDEISYIGWFGKNSDMCVDLQFIADFHKFEIDYLLKSYGIAIADVPKGDLYSGLSDEEVFNTSYLDLAYYSYCKCKNLPVSFNETLEKLHTKNYHKYMGQTFNPYFIKDDDYYFIYKGNTI